MTSSKIQKYWSEVADQLAQRSKQGEEIAGDNDLFYVYKRKIFLEKLAGIINWEAKDVLEYGCGPGGNLVFLAHHGVNSLVGIDISSEMLNLARKNIESLDTDVDLIHNNGINIPLEDKKVNVVFTSTVLQHNIDDKAVEQIIRELCRVSSDVVILCEHTESRRKVLHDHFVGRTVQYYKDQVCKNNYTYEGSEYLDIRVSYYLLGIIRKVFNSRSRKEGEPLSPLSIGLQKMVFGATKLLDPLVSSRRDLTLMVFRKVK